MSFPGQTSIHQGAFYNRDFFSKKINQSLRFNDNDSPYLTFTPESAGNRRKWTWSGWFKRGVIPNNTTQYVFLGAATASTGGDAIMISDTEKFSVNLGLVGNSAAIVTTQVLRDASTWYHFVVSVDTEQATESNRVKIYVNGGLVTDFSTSTYPSQNFDCQINNSQAQYISRHGNAPYNGYLDGYLAEVHFIDGSAIGPENFGVELNGVWTPIGYSGEYGTNGWHLDFADSGDIGNNANSSDGTNDWTPNNFVASDVVPDSPTNSFCTLNSVEFVDNSGFLSEGNLKISDTSSANLTASGGTIGMKSGKWYWEAHLIVQENGFNIGVVKDTESATSGTWNYTKTNFYAISGIGTSYVTDGAGGQNAAGTTFAQGDIVRVAYDADTGKLYFGKNDTWLNSADPAAGTGNLETTSAPEYGYHPATSTVGDASGYSDVIMNFGQDSTFVGNLSASANTDASGLGSFKYSAPAGYKALCIANLPEPSPVFTFRGGNRKPSDYFTTITTTSTGSALEVNTGFAPDFLWTKARNFTRNHELHDTVRGNNVRLQSSATTAQQSYADYLTFNSDGATFGTNHNIGYHIDGTTNGVVYAWRAGGAPTTDNVAGANTVPTTGSAMIDGVATTDRIGGTIAIKRLSASRVAGFSIVQYVGTQQNDTVGHGLAQTPEMVIVKKMGGAASDWSIYHHLVDVDSDGAPETDFLEFDTNSALDSSAEWGDIPFTNETFGVGNGTQTNDNSGGGVDHIAYCWHSVPGFSKFGEFFGNSNADGTFVHTGFRPRWIMIKSTLEVSAPYTGWCIIDAATMQYNADEQGTQLWANAAYVQGLRGNGSSDATVGNFDFLSNGFKLRSNLVEVNYGSQQYIYMAFAEDPFNFANAR